jgi:hypothetical protein
MVRYLNMVSWNIITVYIQNGSFSQWLHTLCNGSSCHAGLLFQSSWLLHESVAPSSAADQLLILLPAWRAGPSSIPPSRVDPIPSGSRHLPASLSATCINAKFSCYTNLVEKVISFIKICISSSFSFSLSHILQWYWEIHREELSLSFNWTVLRDN